MAICFSRLLLNRSSYWKISWHTVFSLVNLGQNNRCFCESYSTLHRGHLGNGFPALKLAPTGIILVPFWHTRAFHQQYTIKALGKELTAFRDLCRALVHLLSSDETLKILIQNETLKFLITCAIPGLMNLNVVEVQIFIYFHIIYSSTLD